MIFSVPPSLRDTSMQRIVIIGSPGSGKSTLARQLGAILQIEVIHLDRLFWKPGWVETPHSAWRKLQEALVQRERWIMDGNYGATQDVRLVVADTAIFLDISRFVCMWRVLKRRVQYHGRSRPDLPPECPEALDWKFVRYTWSYPAQRRLRIMDRLAQYAHKQRIVVLHSRAEVQQFLTAIKCKHMAAGASLSTMVQS